MSIDIPQLSRRHLHFPNPTTALRSPDGLLAVGGDLSPSRLVAAYRQGIFPWFSNDEPILWWSPNPRAVITPESLKISSSMQRLLHNNPYTIRWNTAFDEVVSACAAPRAKSPGTWIVPAMQTAYCELHKFGVAHSIEIWHDPTADLVGGLYGLCLGPFFFGESMFSRRSNTSKLALIHLVKSLATEGLQLLDCQIMNPHLQSLGALAMPRSLFLETLQSGLKPLDDWKVTQETIEKSKLIQNSVLNIYLKDRKE